jgi:hypothetical protein
MRAIEPFVGALLGAALWTGAAHAADWQHILGTEPDPKAPPIKLFGFIQPELALNTGGPATGLVGTPLERFEGVRPLYNRAGEGPASFGVRRARLAARGALPGSDNRVNYFIMAEFGVLGLTRSAPVVLTDASVTLSYVPGARLRVGQFKLPIMDEVYGSVPAVHPFTNFSTTLVRLLLENPIRGDEYLGGADGFRDVGAMVFDGFQGERWAGSYALMVSNGSGINRLDDDLAKDVAGRVELARVFSGERHDMWRQELRAGAWGTYGRRSVAEDRVDRIRFGGFAHAELDRVWTLIEVAGGRGALDLGPQPPFPGEPVRMSADGAAWGLVAQSGVRLPYDEKGRVGLQARFERFEQLRDAPADHRVFLNATGAVEVSPARNLRFLLDYEHRTLRAPSGSDAARALAAGFGDRVTLQVTARY